LVEPNTRLRLRFRGSFTPKAASAVPDLLARNLAENVDDVSVAASVSPDAPKRGLGLPRHSSRVANRGKAFSRRRSVRKNAGKSFA
jgi:hypothetical protein